MRLNDMPSTVRRTGLLLFALSLAVPARSVTLDAVRRALTTMEGATALTVRIASATRRVEGKLTTESSGRGAAALPARFPALAARV